MKLGVLALVTGAGWLVADSVVAPSVAPAPFQIEVPGRIIANFFVVETCGAAGEVARFVIDTGSSISVVTPAYAAAHTGSQSTRPVRDWVEVSSSDGRSTQKREVILPRLRLGSVQFAEVPAVVSDLSELSRHLGVTVDGIVGFPVFQPYLLTLDYGRAVLTVGIVSALSSGENRGRERVFFMRDDHRVPLVSMQIGGQRCEVLLDTGSDGGVQLNPEQVSPRLASPVRPGALVATVAGDRRQYLGRIADDLELGGVRFAKPVVDFSLGMASVGGELLKHFAVTFNQRHNEVTFRRVTTGAVRLEARRSVGLSFARTAEAWRIAAVLPETPSAELRLQPGDRCVKINGEPVDHWPGERYAALLNSAEKVTFTFAHGTTYTDHQIPVISLL